MAVRNILQTRKTYARRQIDVVRSFLTTPRGVFETVDEIIRNFRAANRATLRQLTSGKMRIRVLEKFRF